MSVYRDMPAGAAGGKEGAVLGFILGVVFGGVQLALLLLAVSSVGTGKLKIWPLAVQFLCPFAGLLLCAFLVKEQLLICAVTISSLLIVGAVIKFISARKGKKG